MFVAILQLDMDEVIFLLQVVKFSNFFGKIWIYYEIFKKKKKKIQIKYIAYSQNMKFSQKMNIIV